MVIHAVMVVYTVLSWIWNRIYEHRYFQEQQWNIKSLTNMANPVQAEQICCQSSVLEPHGGSCRSRYKDIMFHTYDYSLKLKLLGGQYKQILHFALTIYLYLRFVCVLYVTFGSVCVHYLCTQYVCRHLLVDSQAVGTRSKWLVFGADRGIFNGFVITETGRGWQVSLLSI